MQNRCHLFRTNEGLRRQNESLTLADHEVQNQLIHIEPTEILIVLIRNVSLPSMKGVERLPHNLLKRYHQITLAITLVEKFTLTTISK